MKAKPVIPRTLARQDVDEAVAFYIAEGSEKAATGLVDALEKAFRHISRQPATGSPRLGQVLNLPDLRSWPLARYPYLVFYVERTDHIDVWRVLHSRRDIPNGVNEALSPEDEG